MAVSETVLFLAKLVASVASPLGLSIGLMLLAGLCALVAWRWLARIGVAAGVVVLWISATPAFADWALGSLEGQYTAMAIEDTPKADVAIVLGGAVGQPVPPRTTLELGDASDRVLHALRLYRAGKVGKIIVTAGNLPWLPNAKPEADLIKALLIEWGAPAEAIITATDSRNTYENALEARALQKELGFGSALLVTSAFHMPRAMGVFRKAGIAVTAAPVDVAVVEKPERTVLDWLPDAGALEMTSRAAREWIGTWGYWARGYWARGVCKGERALCGGY